MYARSRGAGPDELRRAYAAGTLADSALGLGGSVAAAGAARTGFRAPGAQAAQFGPGGLPPAATEPVSQPPRSAIGTADRVGNAPPALFDGALATRQILGTATTPAGRQIMFHAADRMVNPPSGRAPMSPAQVDQVLDGATSVVKRQYHPLGGTLTIENANMPGRPRVIVDEATGQRIITVINPRAE